MFRQDIYILGASDPFEINNSDEVTVDLKLKRVPPCYHTCLTGRVLYRDIPIFNATVKVFDKNFKPLFHTATNEKGIYCFYHLLCPGEYKVIAAANGFRTSVTENVRIIENTIMKVSFVLKKSSLLYNGLVYGKVIEAVSRKPIANATVYLRDFTRGYRTTYKTTTNHSGYYLIYDILPNKYQMTVKKQGYMLSGPIQLLVEKKARIDLHVDLIRKQKYPVSTISGNVNFEDNPVPDLAVFLYRIEDSTKLSLMQIQQTNEEGIFLFSGVEQGIYRIKGKLQNGKDFEKAVQIR